MCLTTALLLTGAEAASELTSQQGLPPASSDITLVVDGVLRKTWSAAELMRGRFDWVSPKGFFAPAVPLSFVVFSEASGVDFNMVDAVSVLTQNGTLRIDSDHLELLQDLVLRVDLTRDGTWQLVGADREAEGRLRRLVGNARLSRVQRVDVRSAEQPSRLEGRSSRTIPREGNSTPREGSSARPRGHDTNDIQLFVDGELARTWTVRDLMRGRFDWVSPQGRFSPAVPVSFLLHSEQVALPASRVTTVKFVARRSTVVIHAPDLALIESLILRLDLTRGGTWQLVGRDEASDDRLRYLSRQRLFKLERIEVTLDGSE